MKVIIAGSRTITDPLELEAAIKDSGFQITEVISGGAQGIDSLGAAWAQLNNIPCGFFLPDWEKHGKAAGPIRNSLMAAEAEALILVWDGVSRGSQDMLNKATSKGLKVHTRVVQKK